MKLSGIPIGSSHKPSKDGKTLVANEKRLDVSKRIQKRKSKRVTVKKRVEQDYRP